MKLKRIITVLMSAVLMLSAVGCKDETVKDMEMIKTSDKSLIVIENENLRVKLDKKTGYISTITNKTGKTEFVQKEQSQGNWPFYIEYSDDSGSRVYSSSVGRTTNNTISSLKVNVKENGDEQLTVTYNDLLRDGNSADSTGIKAVVTYNIGKNAEHFSYNVALDLTSAKYNVTSLHLSSGGDLRSGAGRDEFLTAPVWGTGTKWANPMYNDAFIAGKTLAYPGNGKYTLESGWLDLHGEDIGIGVGYINKQQTACEFRIESSSNGMSMEVVLFEPLQILGESVPLKKGETFTSGDMLIGSHSGSWHTFADIYREEFNKAFTLPDGTPDYLTEETLSSKAKNLDYFMRETGIYDGAGSGNFKQMKDNVYNLATATGAKLDHTFLWLVGINANEYGRDVPFLMPLNERLAETGKTALETYNENIVNLYQKAGGQIMQYTHPFAMDIARPENAALFDKINPYQHKEDWNVGEHWSVCMDNNDVKNLWKEDIIPQFKALNADAVQFDQGSLIQTVCDMQGHNHGLDAVSRLSSGTKAMNDMAKLVKSELGDDAWILSEATNDLTCRYIDVRQNHWYMHPPIWGGEYEYGAEQYTFPQYKYSHSNFVTDPYGNISTFFLESAVLGGMVLLTDSANDAKKIEYVRATNELRENNVPGYPFGYRDTVGITTSLPSIFARVYVKDNKVTVVYCAGQELKDQSIVINLEKLGFKGKSSITHTVNLASNTVAYATFTVE